MESLNQTYLVARDGAAIISLGSISPLTTPSLTANLVCRVMLAVIGNLVCLVPLRLLRRNGEFAATVFIVNLEVKNFKAVLNALIWRDDSLDAWWPGYGLCDTVPYLHNFTQGVYATCMLAIMRHLALQVGLLRASPLTVTEKRKRNLVQASIIFPLPLLQLLLTWPLATQRFAVGTLIGCIWVPYPCWLYLVFFIIPPMVIAVLTVIYAGRSKPTPAAVTSRTHWPELIRPHSTHFYSLPSSNQVHSCGAVQ